jgi:hypothetical protein
MPLLEQAIPIKKGMPFRRLENWIPAFAGMTPRRFRDLLL